MTILQLISSEGYYGAESMMVALARTLPSLGFRSIVGVFRDGRADLPQVAAKAKAFGLQVETIPCSGRCDARAVRRIRQLVEANGVDVLHTHGYKADIYGYLAAWPDRVTLVATCHNWPSRLLSMRAYAAADRLVLRCFDRVGTASEPVAKVLRRWGMPAHKLRIIPNGVDMETFVFTPSVAVTRKRIGFVGRLVPEKGGAFLLTAAQSVLAEFPRARFIFAGEGQARSDWEELASRLGIAAQVSFIGRQENMPAFYASVDMVVLPSLQEAMPMCLLEALAASRPVVATAVGAVPAVIRPGVTGLLCEPADTAGLSAAIRRLLRDPALAQALAARGRSHVEHHFSSQVISRSYTGLYREALTEAKRPAQAEAIWQRSRL